MRIRAFDAVAAILLGAVACSSGNQSSSPSASPSSQVSASGTATQLVDSALHSASGQGSVHYVQTTPLPKSGVGTSVGDVANDQGKQLITDPPGRVTTLVAGGSAYFRGNPQGLRSVGVPIRQAQAWANRWVQVPSSSPLYMAVTDQVTLSSVLPYITPTGPLQLNGMTTIRGMRAIAVSGGKPMALNGAKTTGSSILYLDPNAPHLPIAFDYTPSHDRTERWLFSNWGEAVNIQTPTTGLTA